MSITASLQHNQPKLDANNDGKVSVSEQQNYVREKIRGYCPFLTPTDASEIGLPTHQRAQSLNSVMEAEIEQYSYQEMTTADAERNDLLFSLDDIVSWISRHLQEISNRRH